jgi:hypothetical protein
MGASSLTRRRFLHNPAVRVSLMLLLSALCAVAVAASAQGRESAYVTFRLPSKNVHCAYATGFGPAFLRCDIFSGLTPRPRGACPNDWVGLTLTARSVGPTCAGDTVAVQNAAVLGYGKVWKRGPFTCLSARVGLSCANRAGQGFFLSRERWAVG